MNKQKLDDSIYDENLQETQFQKNIITIDISFVIGGEQAARGLVTLIKSILLQRSWEKSIEFSKSTNLKSIGTFKEKKSIMDNVNHMNECYIRHINLHLISDYHAFKSLSTLFDTWKIPNFDVYFYQLELYLVINLDVDLLVNSDLLELWAHFQKFNFSQVRNLYPLFTTITLNYKITI
ncbi:unnamed protein product [Schistosoma margrebowiei]|uniref:Uncharacterized protein n=1 Tax=Schistosoma margrebowiei TaxID=48269 RepID=A0A183LKY6_9TREM|nr:unnamed protein product [Schistosoma margrebowiei]